MQIEKLNQYKKMINIFQNSFSIKKDQSHLLIKKLILL